MALSAKWFCVQLLSFFKSSPRLKNFGWKVLRCKKVFAYVEWILLNKMFADFYEGSNLWKNLKLKLVHYLLFRAAGVDFIKVKSRLLYFELYCEIKPRGPFHKG